MSTIIPLIPYLSLAVIMQIGRVVRSNCSVEKQSGATVPRDGHEDLAILSFRGIQTSLHYTPPTLLFLFLARTITLSMSCMLRRNLQISR